MTQRKGRMWTELCRPKQRSEFGARSRGSSLMKTWLRYLTGALVLAACLGIGLGAEPTPDSCPLGVQFSGDSCRDASQCLNLATFQGIERRQPVFIPQPYEAHMTWIPADEAEASARLLSVEEVDWDREFGYRRTPLALFRHVGSGSTPAWTLAKPAHGEPGAREGKGRLQVPAGSYRLKIIYAMDEAEEPTHFCLLITEPILFGDNVVIWGE